MGSPLFYEEIFFADFCKNSRWVLPCNRSRHLRDDIKGSTRRSLSKIDNNSLTNARHVSILSRLWTLCFI